jgi:hypothetical protein
VRQFSSLDPDFVQQQRMPQLISQIERVPRRMATTFKGMYEAKLAALPQPPLPLSPAQEAEKAELERKIEILKDFLATL